MDATRKTAPIDVAPNWQILAPEAVVSAGKIPIRLVAGPGFGDGHHPTTQVCLQALAALAPRGRGWRLLDFGSGSGILSIAGSLLGATTVDAVEIDLEAVAHAEANVAANGVAARVRQVRSLGETSGPFDLVVANILRLVLLEFAEALVPKCGGALVLSGLVATDVPELSARYAPLTGERPEIYDRGEWRALVWRRAGAGR